MKRKLSKILGIGLSIALMTSLLIAAVPAIALSTPKVTFGIPYFDNVISTVDGDYIIRFKLEKQVGGNSTNPVEIIIEFPDETTIGDTVVGTISAGPGWVDNGSGTAVWVADPPILNQAKFTSEPEEKTITYTIDTATTTYIGEGAEVRIEITTGITNPSTPGDYVLSVTTYDVADDDEIEGPVDSDEYSIISPMISPLSGIVIAYNDEGIMMYQDHSIVKCIAKAGEDGTVEVGPGTYEEDIVVTVPGLTIKGTGDQGTNIIKDNGGTNALRIEAGNVTLDNLTFTTSVFGQSKTLISVHEGDATITNCELTAGEDTSSAIYIGPDGPDAVISDTTIDITAKGAQTGIRSKGEDVKVTDCTITVGKGDQGIFSSKDAKITGVTIDGSSGYGIDIVGGTVTIDDTSFMSLDEALYVDSSARDATVTLKNSVVDGCGAKYDDAIVVDDATLYMVNNTVQNTYEDSYAISLSSDADVEIHFNNILNNGYGIEAAGTANCSHNWWGSADGPALGVNGGLGLVVKPYLKASVASADMAVGKKSLDAEDTVGIVTDIIDTSGNAMSADIIAVAKYTVNPESVTPMIFGTGSVLGYYDLYVRDAEGNVRVKFYGAPSKYTKLYYSGGISGTWDAVPNTQVNTSEGYLYVTIGGKDTGLIPADLAGTEFALVEDKTTSSGPPIGSPDIGDYDISIEPMFTWEPPVGAAVLRYEIALSEDPTFTIIEWSYNVDQKFYKVDEPLRYSTTYYWRVRGVLGEPYQEAGQWKTPATPWTVGIFTTEDEPAPPPDPIVVTPTKPEVNVEIPPTKITIEPAEQAIPNYMLWIIVAVGAILVIALIVLIVRTRRVV